ncbi:Trk family potassium uptake protein [Candidatus Woesearchaeota archaeon]|nr:Trk family potassium uptake protein [Candidatus Woesearchaeota archaeon]
MKPLIFKLEKPSLLKQINPLTRQYSPIQLVVLSYIVVILLGAALLAQPFATKTYQRTHFIDALFTSTSAVAVTGLVVKDTATYWSPIGQAIILLLIQIGGLGYVTIFMFFFLVFQRKVTLKQEMMLQETLNNPTIREIMKLARHILYFVVIFEGVGAIILFLRFLEPITFYPFAINFSNFSISNIFYSAWRGIFHAISAFNNAGFDLMGNFKSFTEYVGDPIITFTITSLIILGGIGFYVLSDAYKTFKGRQPKLSYHSKIAISATIFLIVTGTLLVFILEYDNPKTIGNLNLPGKVMASYFQSVTARTAGFNTIATGALTNATLLFIIALMFIGASPGGTGGGIKTTTATAIFYYIRSMINRKNTVEIGNRRIPYDAVNKAVTILVISITFIFFMTLIISSIEPFAFVRVLFEVVSAFGTVGLSTGITPFLSPISKFLISLTMFTGRVGTLSIILIFSMQLRRGKVLLPTEELTVG